MGNGSGGARNAPLRGVVGRAATTTSFDLDRWAPSAAAGVDHFWSVTWDLRGREPLPSSVITFPSLHLTHEWGSDSPRHEFALPTTLVHGVVERVCRTTIGDQGAVVGARFHPGGFTARFGRAAAELTGRIEPVDAESLFGAPVHLEEDVTSAVAGMDDAIGAYTGDSDPTYESLTALVARIRDDDRLHRVEQVMALSPWSARATQRVFRRYVGVSVKWVLCRYRLQQAALEIETHPGVDFADLAVRLGWYDQANSINDFRSMLGTTPGEYAGAHGG